MMRKIRTTALPMAAAVLAVGTLVGCGGDDGDKPEPEESGSASQEPVAPTDDRKLGAALDRMVYQGLGASKDGGRCLVTAVRGIGVSPAAEAFLVEANGDDWSAVASGMRAQLGDADADSLTGAALHDAVDACVNADLGVSEEAPEAASPAEPGAGAPWKIGEKEKGAGKAKPNLKPKYEIKADEVITTSGQLRPGLVAMLSSFGDEDLVKLMDDSGECMVQAVLDAKFSQKALRFLAGGAPLGSGSVVENLASDTDKKIWKSQEFVSTLSECTN